MSDTKPLNPWARRALTPKPESVVQAAVLETLGNIQAQDAIIEGKQPVETLAASDERITDSRKLSQLVDENFPFDDSQLAAINGMIAENYACLTGAAGTGKTTTTKKLVDELQNQTEIDYVNMKEYWKAGLANDDPDDDYEVPDHFIPAIAMVGFTGRSAQMIKKNFPRDWHGNIMTIHRLLGFKPEFYDDYDVESDEYRKKMRFVPSYTAGLQLPWDIVIVDEAGMLGMDLWNQLWAAMKPGARIYMIGDINQLPPVHGRSIFGFAMSRWPSFELTHIHRQKGENNAIVDSAWRVLQGLQPESAGKFQMLELKGTAQDASRQVRAMMPKLKERGIYDPIRDTIITPINGEEGSRGFALGQLPLNQEFALIFNPTSTHPRYIIDGGRERKMFAVGDKVMATKNDHEAGITNGMTGIITSIVSHGGYGGDARRFGLVEDVNRFILEDGAGDGDDEVFSLEDLSESMEAINEGKEQAKEKRDRGPASHIVNVRFGDDEHGFDIPFSTLSEVGSLMMAYVVTCHKMQGGESPTIIIICHDAHKQMLYREWLYTAITRASDKCILLYTPLALRTALNKQNIKGTTLKQKIESFNLLQRDNGLGAAINVRLPNPKRFDDITPIELPEGIADSDEESDEDSDSTAIVPYEAQEMVEAGEDSEIQDATFEDIEVVKVEEIPGQVEPEVIHVHHHHHHETTVFVPIQTPFMKAVLKEQRQADTAARFNLDTRSSKNPSIEPAPRFVALPAPDPYQWVEPESGFIAPKIDEYDMLAESGSFGLRIAQMEQPQSPPKSVNAWAALMAKR